MAEYIVLIIGAAEEWWTGEVTEQQRAAGYAAHEKFAAALAGGDHTITGGAELHAPSTARTVPPGGGTPTDGPYAETAEQIGGFYRVSTEDLDGLLECCQVLAELGDAIQVVQVVTPEERP